MRGMSAHGNTPIYVERRGQWSYSPLRVYDELDAARENDC